MWVTHTLALALDRSEPFSFAVELARMIGEHYRFQFHIFAGHLLVAVRPISVLTLWISVGLTQA